MDNKRSLETHGDSEAETSSNFYFDKQAAHPINTFCMQTTGNSWQGDF